MANIFKKRLTVELNRIKTSQNSNCSATAQENDITRWNAKIIGPEGTPYEGGEFTLSIIFGAEYPIKPPKVTFVTPVYHPNVSQNGAICLDILSSQWTPALTVEKMLLSICSLLSDPNPDDPLFGEAAKEYKNNRELYNKKAREMTLTYAIKKSD